jgi:DNA-directed RNA polymerase specialized sigma24 family protein
MPRQASKHQHNPMREAPLESEIVFAERQALWQQILVYPAAQRREVLRRAVLGIPDSLIAADLTMPLADVHAILQALDRLAHLPLTR